MAHQLSLCKIIRPTAVWLGFLCLVFSSLRDVEGASCGYTTRKQAFDDLVVNSGYKIRPSAQTQNTKVNVSLVFLDFYKLDEIAGTIYATISLEMKWFDPQLVKSGCEYDDFELTLKQQKKLFIPTVVVSGIDGHVITIPIEESKTKIMKGGYIDKQIVFEAKVMCNMNFRRFPFDDLHCDFIVSITRWDSYEVQFDKLHVSDTFDSLASHEIDFLKPHDKQVLLPDGTHKTVHACQLHLIRYTIYYVTMTYTPNLVTVMVAWLSFSINPDSVPARVALGISSLIAMSLQYGNVVEDLPKKQYVKSMDVWNIGCIFFIFYTLAEYTYIMHMLREADEDNQAWTEKAAKPKIKKIDWWSRLIYPIIYALFSLIYFAVTMN